MRKRGWIVILGLLVACGPSGGAVRPTQGVLDGPSAGGLDVYVVKLAP